MITILGSCRVNIPDENTYLNAETNYTHCTKEAIQLILFLKGDLTPEYPFNINIFRSGILKKYPIILSDEFRRLFNETDLFIVEICSLKKYTCKEYYLYDMCVNKNAGEHNTHESVIWDNLKIEKQEFDEIEEDILKINELLSPKKILFVTHYNNDKIKDIDEHLYHERSKLVEYVIEICKKYNLNYICPGKEMTNYDFERIVVNDLCHYTEEGQNIWFDILRNKIKEIRN